MKPSEVIRYYLPFYAKDPRNFMCNMIRGCYSINDEVGMRHGIEEKYYGETVRTIEHAIDSYTTLHSYLKYGLKDKHYLDLLKDEDRDACHAHAYRVKWFEELVTKLEKRGE